MYVESVTLTDYRNYASAAASLGPGLTLLVGPNGQGKTNLLEALSLAAGRGPARFGGNEDLVRHGRERAHVEVSVRTRGGRPAVSVTVDGGNRHLYVNGKRARSVADSPAAATAFCPETVSLVKGGASERRQLLDDLLERIRPPYRRTRAEYGRTLRQRNRALQLHRGSEAALETWDEQLAELGAEVVVSRLRLVEKIGPLMSEAYGTLAGNRQPSASATYQCALADGGTHTEAIATRFLSELRRRRSEELARGVTLVGPHRDDLLLQLGGHDLRRLGSQGEQRTAALALMLAEAKILEGAVGEQPVLLLDDVLSELDETRRRLLLEAASAAEQAILTTTRRDAAKETPGAHAIHVAEGKLSHG